MTKDHTVVGKVGDMGYLAATHDGTVHLGLEDHGNDGPSCENGPFLPGVDSSQTINSISDTVGEAVGE